MFSKFEERHESADVVALERPELLIICGLVGILGSLAPIVTLVLGTVVTQHDFVADTISDLARGEKKWIMDLGFYLNAAGMQAIALAAAHAHLGRVGWSLGLICLSLLSMVVVMLGLWDEFGVTQEDPTGMSVHTKLTFALGPLYLAGPLLMMPGAGGVRHRYGYLFAASALLWVVFATAFKLAPDAYDGLLEKIGIAATWLWTMPLSILYIARGAEKRHRMT